MARVQKFEGLKIWQMAWQIAVRVYALTRVGVFSEDEFFYHESSDRWGNCLADG